MHPAGQNQKWKIKALSEDLESETIFVPYISITESQLDITVFDAEVNLANYNLLRSDRVDRSHGGVILYSYKSIIIDDSSTYSDTQCSAAMIYSKHQSIIVITIYRPPNADEISFTACMDKIKTFISQYEDADIIWTGDLNFKFVKWETETMETNGIPLSERRQAEVLLDYMDQNLLIQTVKETTRANKSILDLVIVNNEDLIHSIEINKTKYSDHDIVKVNLVHKNLLSRNDKQKNESTQTNTLDNMYMLNANWPKIKQDLQKVNWDVILNEEEDIEKWHEVIEKEVTNICAKHTPLRRKGQAKEKIPRHRLALIRKKKNVSAKLNMYKYVKDISTMSETKRRNKIETLTNKKLEIEMQIAESHKQEMLRKEIEAIKHIKRNPKAFFTYMKKHSKVATDIGPLKDSKGNIHSEPKIKADILQNQYQKVFSDPTKASTENIKVNENPEFKIEDIDFSVEDIKEAIESIPTFAAPGPDKFPAVILKECKNELSYPLYKLWRKSLNEGKIPGKLKLQSIIPIFKKGSKALAENYRPVSLTSHIIKVFGRIMRKEIVKFIEENHLLSEAQFGFRIGRNTVTQLLEHFDNILRILEEDENADVVYLDFAKAFDKVDHKILLHKLKSMGIQGKLLTWIEEFITNRTQQVIVEGDKSKTENVRSGVPQGTVLGPVLFIIYINDLADAIKHSQLLIFADDSKFTKNIRNNRNHNELQTDLNAAIKWATQNNMLLNNDKFQLLQHGRHQEYKTDYKIDDTNSLKKSTDVKDLGIHISEDLTWDTHITNIINSSKKYTNWILRTFKSRSSNVILFLFKTFVIPKLEYGCQVWSPYLKKDIIRVESLQKTLTSKIEGLDGLNYHQRLKHLKLYSMQRRRERYIMITMWKIYKEFIPNHMKLDFYQTPRFGAKARRKYNNAARGHIHTVRFHNFTSLGPALFNLIPKFIKEKNSMDSFKHHLDIFLQKIPDCPPSPGYVCVNNNSIVDWAQIRGVLAGGGDDHNDGEAAHALAIR